MIRAWQRLLAWWRKFRTPVGHTTEGTPPSPQPPQPEGPAPWSAGAPDPTLGWARATGYSYFSDRDWNWLPFIIRLKSGPASKFWEAVDRLERQKVLRIPSPYRASARSGKVGQTLTVQVLENEFAQVMSDEAWMSSIEASEFCVPLPKPVTSRPFPVPDPAHIQPYPDPPDDAIVVGIIDDAIAFANHRFRWANGTTRFHDIWQQDGLGPHPTFGYGAEFDAPGINDVLRLAANLALDESEIYARAGVEDYIKDAHKTIGRRRAHGAHVADLACGFDPAAAPAKEILMGVQLDQAAVRSIHPAHLSIYILDALHFIVAKTEALEQSTNKTYAIVVNISFGWYTGPHDGSTPLEKAIDDLVQTRSNIKPMHVVLPAGNSRQERTHARLVLGHMGGGNDTRQLNWRLPPDSRAASMMEIWPRRASDEVQLTLQGPGNSVAVTVTAGNTSNILINGQNVGVIDYKTLVGGKGQRGMRIWLAPTASLDPPVVTVPSGDWTITIKNARNKRCMLDAWIARSGRLPGWPIFGRQSTFEDPAYERYEAERTSPSFRPQQPQLCEAVAHAERNHDRQGAGGCWRLLPVGSRLGRILVARACTRASRRRSTSGSPSGCGHSFRRFAGTTWRPGRGQSNRQCRDAGRNECRRAADHSLDRQRTDAQQARGPRRGRRPRECSGSRPSAAWDPPSGSRRFPVYTQWEGVVWLVTWLCSDGVGRSAAER